MGKPSDTIVPAEVRRAALKEQIKSTIRQMCSDAAAGQIQLPKGLENTDAVAVEYRARLKLMDRLLNPPWARANKPDHELLRDLKLVEDVDASLDRLVDQVAALADAPRKPKRRNRKK